MDYVLAYLQENHRLRLGQSHHPDPTRWPSIGDSYHFLHKVRILPVIARMQWVFSHSAGRRRRRAATQPAAAWSRACC